MKRLLITLTVVLSLITLSSFSNGEKVNDNVLTSFNTSFKNATEVTWSTTAHLYKAKFVYNSQYLTAFYDADGNMIAVTRNISSFQLPICLQTSLKKDYEHFWISDLFEVSREEGTSYYVTLENADTKIILKSSSNSEWTPYQKQRKS